MAEGEQKGSTLQCSDQWQTRARRLKSEPNLVTRRVVPAQCDRGVYIALLNTKIN
jgi:hypothetical protein